MSVSPAGAAVPAGDGRRWRHGDIAIEVIDDARSLAASGADWDRLQDAACHRHVLLDRRFIDAWWRHFGAGKRMRTLVLRRAGAVFAIAPLMLSHGREVFPTSGKNVRIADDYRYLPATRWRRLVPIRRLGFALNFPSSNIRSHLLLADDGDAGAIGAVLAWCAAVRADWDLLALDGIPVGSAQARLLAAAAPGCGLAMGRAHHVRAFLSASLPATMEAFLGARSASFRRWLKRAERDSRAHTAALGELAVREYRGADIDAGMDTLFALEQQSWKVGQARSRALHLVLDDTARAFHRDVARAFAARDAAQVLVTTVGERAVNALFCLERGGVSSGVLTYRAEAFADRVAVAPLWRRYFELGIARGLNLADLNGNNDYLARYADGSAEYARLVFYHGGPYSTLLRVVADAASRAARGLRRA
ncbi:MAG: GNAT family N-acetyltransferase [Gammaproteobacteria bacterium]